MNQLKLLFIFFLFFSLLSFPGDIKAASSPLHTGNYTSLSNITVPQKPSESVTVTISTTAEFYYYYVNNTMYTGSSSFTIPSSQLTAGNDIIKFRATVKNRGSQTDITTLSITVVHNYTEDFDAPVISLTPSTTALTGKNVSFSYTITDASNMTKISYASGDQPLSFFVSGGTSPGTIKTGSFSISENGIYTFYAEDTFNNKSRLVFQVNNIEKSPPELILSAVRTSETQYTINVNATDNNGISKIKWALGSQSASYFFNNGTDISNNSFVVNKNSIYTVFVEDSIGNTIVKTITIDDLPIPSTNISVDRSKYYLGNTINVSFPVPDGGYEASTTQIQIAVLNPSGMDVTSKTFVPSFDGIFPTLTNFSVNSQYNANGSSYLVVRRVYNGKQFVETDRSSTFTIETGIGTDKLSYNSDETVTAFWTLFPTYDQYYLDIYEKGGGVIKTLNVPSSESSAVLSPLPDGEYFVELLYAGDFGMEVHTSNFFKIGSETVYENIFNEFGSINFGSFRRNPGTIQKIKAISTERTSLEFIQGNPTKSKYQVTMKLTPFTSPSGNQLSASNFSLLSATRTSPSGTSTTGPFVFSDNVPTTLLDLSASTSPYTGVNKLDVNAADFELTIPANFIATQTENFTSTITYSVSLIP